MRNVTPILKWVGGKTRLIPELMRRVPANYGRYFEPFCGGAALFFRLAPASAVLSDANRDLMLTYEAVRDDLGAVACALAKHAKTHDAKHYYMTRDHWNAGRIRTKTARAAAFIYLNKTCFNGLWRVNRAGAFNTPIGRYTKPAIYTPDALRGACAALAAVDLRNVDYAVAVADATRGDLVYFDPPYDPVTTTSNFVGYTACSFDKGDQRALADLAHSLVGRGVHTIISNSDTPFVHALYRGLKIDRVRCSRTINSKATKRGAVNELIIVGDPRKDLAFLETRDLDQTDRKLP